MEASSSLQQFIWEIAKWPENSPTPRTHHVNCMYIRRVFWTAYIFTFSFTFFTFFTSYSLLTKVSTGGPKLRRSMLLRIINKNILFSMYRHCCMDKMASLWEQQRKFMMVLISIQGTVLLSLFRILREQQEMVDSALAEINLQLTKYLIKRR